MSDQESTSGVNAAESTLQDEHRCVACGYVLKGLRPSGRCPECGKRYRIAHNDRPRFPFNRWKYWFPAAVMLGVVWSLWTLGVLYAGAGWGWTALIVLPFCVGAIITYGCRWRTVGVAYLWLAILSVVGSVVILMSFADGLFCGVVLVIIWSIPFAIGMAAGRLLRDALRSSGYSQAAWFPIVLLLLLPFAGALLERAQHRAHPISSVSTTRVINASAEDTWESLVFYEDVDIPPPLLARLGLPRPIQTQGSMQSIGDVMHCTYQTGRISKLITDVQDQRVLHFQVVHQSIGIEQHVTLLSGSFELIPNGPDSTMLVLTTTYEPHLQPRQVWTHVETATIRDVHDHVCRGISANLSATRAP